MPHRFQENSQFALLAVNNAYVNLPHKPFQLSDGTWILHGVPVTDDLGTWEKWLGSIRSIRLRSANLVLLVEEPSDFPEVLGDAHQRLSNGLGLLYNMLHLGVGIDISDDEGVDRLTGSSVNGVPDIRRVEQMPRFYKTQGGPRAPITRDWLEGCLVLRSGFAATDADKTQFRRVIRGLITLFKGLKEKAGQDRLHQFVRSLEALVLPDVGRTKKQFVKRCQTFARAGNNIRELLSEAFDLRSATEHLNPWDIPVQCYALGEREAVCLQRTRQIERLACDAYSRLLCDPSLREHFRTDDAIATFWNLPETQRCRYWGTPLDISKEPQYDHWGRSSA